MQSAAGDVDGCGVPGPSELSLPHKHGLAKAHVRAVRKEAGSSKWAIRLGKLLEGDPDFVAVDNEADDPMDESVNTAAVGLLDAAQDVWGIILKIEEGAQALLKDNYCMAKEKQKRKEKKAKKKEKQHGRPGKGRRSYSSSGGSSSSSESSSDSLDSGVQRRIAQSLAPTAGYEKTFEATQDAAGAPAFLWIKGEPHFRPRNTRDLIDCSRPPKTPCKVCGHPHLYW